MFIQKIRKIVAPQSRKDLNSNFNFPILMCQKINWVFEILCLMHFRASECMGCEFPKANTIQYQDGFFLEMKYSFSIDGAAFYSISNMH